MKKLIWMFVPLIVIGFLMVSTLPANSTLLTFNLGGDLISATFDDSWGDNNTVRLTMTADNLLGGEFIDNWYFNFDSSLDPTQLSFNSINTSDARPNSIDTGDDAFKADSYGYFDIKFDFPPPPGNTSSKFTVGETVIYDITYISAIDVSSFRSESSIVDGGYFSAAHYQGSGGFISVPDASIMWLLGPAFIILALFERRKAKA